MARGFAAMIETEEGRKRQREIAAQGGAIARDRGKAHRWTPEEAKAAGILGGRKRQEQLKESGKDSENTATEE